MGRADSGPMEIALLIAIVWMLTAGFALTLFSAAKNADRRAEAMLAQARVSERGPHRRLAA